ncbi:MAG: manganese efflux pump [Bacillota bacterium]|nr:manganese efflux pump [Bacillota bacterium]
MTILTLLFVAVALGTDAFSMAVGIGTSGTVRGNRILLVAGVVAIFHVFMPLIGLYLGGLLGRAVGDWAAFIGAIVLVFIGIHMIREALKGEDGDLIPGGFGQVPGDGKNRTPVVVTSAWALVVLAASVSLDALTVGFGLGTVAVNVALTVIVLGLVAGLMTAAGLVFGRRLGDWFGEKAVMLGGVILIGIGIHMAFF